MAVESQNFFEIKAKTIVHILRKLKNNKSRGPEILKLEGRE